MIENERMVRHFANRYRWATRGTGGFDFDDLLQVGRLAAVKASRGWRADGGAPIEAFTLRCMQNDVYKAANEQCSVVRLPHSQLAKGAKRARIVGVDGVDLSAPNAEPSDPFARDRVRETLAKLPERWAYILEQIYVHERLPQDIADELGVSRQRVQQLETKGLAAFRAEWLADCVDVDEETE